MYGHPLEVQVLFYARLRSADERLLPAGDGDRYLRWQYYWLDLERLNRID